MTAQRPPLGITPEKEWIRHRLAELIAATARRLDANLDPPKAWLEEAYRHALALDGMSSPLAPQDSTKSAADTVKPKMCEEEKNQGPIYYIGEF